MNKRIEFIDVARGLAMLLVIFGHCFRDIDVPLSKSLLCFKMPLFFLVSGMFIKPLLASDLVRGVKKAKAILITQIIVVLLASVAPLCRHLLQGAPIDYFTVFDFFGWSVWFLPTLFFCVATFLLVGCVIDLSRTINKVICLITAMIVVPFSVEANKYGFTGFLHCMQIFPVAFSFFMLGSILKPQIAKLEHIHTEITGIAAIVSMCVCVVIANINAPVTFYRNDYGNLFMFYLSALLGCFSVLFFTTFLTSSKLFMYVGKNCIAFYAWNGIIAWGSQNAVTQLLGSLLPSSSVTLVAFASFAIALPILYLIVKFTMRRVPWIYGITRH